MKLKELITKKDLIVRMYAGVTDFNRMLEVKEKIAEPMERILETYEKKRGQLIEMAKEDQDKANKEHATVLEQEINLKLIKVNRDEIKNAGFHAWEFLAIEEYVK